MRALILQPHELRSAFEAGKIARADGKRLLHNPHFDPYRADLFSAWIDGWMAQDRARNVS